MFKRTSYIFLYRFRSDFENEARILSGLNDPNLVHVIGVCVEGEAVGMVCEYTDLGDLHQYLRSHAAETSLVKSARGSATLRCLCAMNWFRLDSFF